MNKTNRTLILTLTLIVIAALPQITSSQANPDSLDLFNSYQKSDFFNKPTLPQQRKENNFSHKGKSQRDQEVLTMFGFDLFSRNNSAILSKPNGTLSLPENYRLGPGDHLGIYMLGAVQENMNLMVNVEGKVYLPPAGVVDVWGLSMQEFRKLLNTKLQQYYDNFTLDVMLLEPKNVMVAVVGDVVYPGKYVSSSLNTVLDVVMMAGGPTENGSIRGIQLFRNDSLVTSVDLYDFLMTGATREDAFLQAGDRIYVPLSKHKVKITGEVGRPSVFELRPALDEKLSDLVKLAGGFTTLAYLDKIELSRLQENGQRKLHYLDFTSLTASDSSADLVLQNADRINVYSKLDKIHKRQVSILGEIQKPGEYLLEDNLHVSDLILKAGNITRKAYTVEVEVAKVEPGKPTRFIKVDLGKMRKGMNGDTDPLLDDDDQVFIREIPDWQVGLTVEIKGEAEFPGFYSIVKDSTRLSDILNKAGGFTDDAFLQEAHLIRKRENEKIDKEFDRLLNMRREEMTDLEYQYFVMRQNSNNVNRIVVDFKKLMISEDSREDLTLENGDVIVVPKKPTVVMVTGSVATPGGVTFKHHAKTDYYLARAGGVSWDANPGKIKIIKVAGEVLNDNNIKNLEAGDIIWVPRRNDKKFWPAFLQTVTVTSQIASIYLIIDRAIAK